MIRDPVAMSEIVKNLSNANVLTPEEARELAGDVFNRDFKRITASWVKQPGAFTIAGIPVEPEKPHTLLGEPMDPELEPDDGSVAPERDPGGAREGVTARARKKLRKMLRGEAGRLLALRQAIDKAEETAWAQHLQEQASTAAE